MLRKIFTIFPFFGLYAVFSTFKFYGWKFGPIKPGVFGACRFAALNGAVWSYYFGQGLFLTWISAEPGTGVKVILVLYRFACIGWFGRIWSNSRNRVPVMVAWYSGIF